MKKRSKSWISEPRKAPCNCGTDASWVRNIGSRERLMNEHKTPDGRPCEWYVQQQQREHHRRICVAAGVEP